jgi:hypothetical protein
MLRWCRAAYTGRWLMLRRQCGQVLCWVNHASMQLKWNQWAHGNTVTSVPSSTASIQIEHSALLSGPIISLSTFFLGKDRMAFPEAGGGAVPGSVCSIKDVMTRSSSSCEYTASPFGLMFNSAESIASGFGVWRSRRVARVVGVPRSARIASTRLECGVNASK